MKMLAFAILSIVLSAATFAKADQLQLNYIDTNNCTRAQNEVRLLRSFGVAVYADCSDYYYRGYGSDQGGWYDYRLTTVIDVAGPIYAGVPVRMNDIDTNDCTFAQHEISLLNSRNVRVDAVCSPYIYEGYPSSNGRFYNYRLYTTITKY